MTLSQIHRASVLALLLLATRYSLLTTAQAQPAPVLADPTTGALFRPAAATFISGNGLLTTSSSLGNATATSITGPTTTNLTLGGGSSGASLILGQGTTGAAAFNSALSARNLISTNQRTALAGGLATITQAGSVTTVNVAVIGDSWTIGETWTSPLRKIWQNRMGDGGRGYIPLDVVNSAPAGVTRTTTGTWTDAASTDSLTVEQTTSTDTATPAKKTITCISEVFVLHFIGKTGGGTFRYRTDSGSWTTVDTSTPTGYRTLTVSGLSRASHSIDYEIVSAGSTGVTLFGVECKVSATSGVRLSPLARNGASAADFAAIDSASFSTGISAINPTAVWVMLGVNDMNASATPATFATNLATITSRIRSALPYADIALISQTDAGFTGTAYPLSDYVEKIRSHAATNGYQFIDLYTALGAYNANTYGLYLGNNHPASTGGFFFSDIIARLTEFRAENATLRLNLAALSGQPGDGTGVNQLTISSGPVQASQEVFRVLNPTGTVSIAAITPNTSNTLSAVTSPDGNVNFYVQAVNGGTVSAGSGTNTLRLIAAGNAAATLTGAGLFTVTGAYVGAVQALSGAGAVDVVSQTTAVTTTGASQALTLANGINGQIKFIVHDVDGGSAVLTPTTKTGFSTVTFTNVGDTVTLQYLTTRGWFILSSYGATVAP
jgi:hypothetical protein